MARQAGRRGARADGLVDGLYHDLHLVAIDFDGADDPQLIFETLNALGTPLLPADLVKNYLFHDMTDESERAIKLYEPLLGAVRTDQDFWRAETPAGAARRVPGSTTS